MAKEKVNLTERDEKMRLSINNIKTDELNFSTRNDALKSKESIIRTVRIACAGTFIAECKNEEYIFQWATQHAKFLRIALVKALR